jgi:hypothetical protein
MRHAALQGQVLIRQAVRLQSTSQLSQLLIKYLIYYIIHTTTTLVLCSTSDETQALYEK